MSVTKLTLVFDWVTKAKRNRALYRKEIESWSGPERYVPLNARMLIKEVFPRLKAQGSGPVSVSIPNIYIKMPYQTTGKRGKTVTKQRYTPTAAVVAMNLKEDEIEQEVLIDAENKEDQAATYRGAYLIIL
ncbi:hypothetical protein UF75_5414 [Desulfosporosinus sp. I2]|uniref:hypothetical protein n=1 Tax=Desulfosporosinus sp. I2 TaxID=1617025 RepID=UPI0005EDA0EA|nr:hypothetical protein [Desulfosporosinus sp. I2]KJR44207.1 hypothetical protein UF75_5414 [Desulfosporosinus sp. I2]